MKDRCSSLQVDSLLVIQTCVPDYRLGLFDALTKRIGRLIVASGPDYFSPTIRDAAEGRQWSVQRSQSFVWGRRFAWLESHEGILGECRAAIHEWNPRIISFWRDLRVCRDRGIPMIVWGHAWGKGGARGFMLSLRHWMARSADGVICYTESQAEFTRKMNPGLPVIAAPNACLSRADCRVAGDEASRDTIIYVGRIVPAKKVALLVEAFATACAADSSFKARLLIVGEGVQRSELTRRAAELGVGKRVTWLGHQSDVAMLRRAYSKAFVSVSPGYVGLSLTQSFAFGVPALIAHGEPHSPEIEAARNGENARFFPAGDIASLARMLLGAWVEWRNIEARRLELASQTAATYSFEQMAQRFCEMVGHFTATTPRAEI